MIEQTNNKSEQRLTIRGAIEYINNTIRSNLPNKDADTLRILEYITGLNETGVLQSMDKNLLPKQIKQLFSIKKSLEAHKPLEYITGIADFHGRKFYVSKYTLIPRAETEMLVDMAVGYASEKMLTKEKALPLTIVDVGTGSGCIIISTALCLRASKNRYIATDISDRALRVARKNIRTYSLGRAIKLLHGNLLEPTDHQTMFDIVIANLPYIKESELSELQPSVKDYEPHVALSGGINGASLIKELLVQVLERLNPKGIILLEIQPKIADTVVAFAKRFYGNARIATVQDLFGEVRFVTIET